MAGSSSNAAAPSLAPPQGDPSATYRVASVNLSAPAYMYGENTSLKKMEDERFTIHGLNKRVVQCMYEAIDFAKSTDAICIREINTTWFAALMNYLGPPYIGHHSEKQCTAVFINANRVEPVGGMGPIISAGSTRIFPEAGADHCRKRNWRSFT